MPFSTVKTDRSSTFDPATELVIVLRGVGGVLAAKLARLGLYVLEDMLFHLPRRYEDRTRITSLSALVPGTHALVEGEVAEVRVTRGYRPMLVCRLSDGKGMVDLRFFHFAASQTHALAVGTRLSVYGEVRGGNPGWEMVHPEYRCMRLGSLREATLTPIYPTTAGLSVAHLRTLIREALRVGLPGLQDPLAALPLADKPSLREALTLLHAPPVGTDEAALLTARCRLALEELATYQAYLRQARGINQAAQARQCPARSALVDRFLATLSFVPTAAQTRVIKEIQADLAQGVPMQRLLQGDVGSGKTLVAAVAALQVIDAGYQVALMVPTELLARQHAATLMRWFNPLGIEVLGLMRVAQGSAALRARLREKSVHCVVGTQALFQETVAFDQLGLVIIDEQHRFGVCERQALQSKGSAGRYVAHRLAMSATPIPRTLAQSVYADLEISMLDERPPGRIPVTTVAIPENRRDEVVIRVRDACAQGAQAYWVCPLIEEGMSDQKAAVALRQELAIAWPGLTVGLIHGRMKASEKDRAMAAFVAGDVRVLVATTVIEVGVDVPQASLLVIESADRLGLAQLHQLRGRVGRGAQAGHCVLLYKTPLSALAHARLAALRETDDGFQIAQRDLDLRGPGEIFGARQTGLSEFRVADLAYDQHLLPAAVAVAALLQQTPETLGVLQRRWLPNRPIVSGA